MLAISATVLAGVDQMVTPVTTVRFVVSYRIDSTISVGRRRAAQPEGAQGGGGVGRSRLGVNGFGALAGSTPTDRSVASAACLFSPPRWTNSDATNQRRQSAGSPRPR